MCFIWRRILIDVSTTLPCFSMQTDVGALSEFCPKKTGLFFIFIIFLMWRASSQRIKDFATVLTSLCQWQNTVQEKAIKKSGNTPKTLTLSLAAFWGPFASLPWVWLAPEWRRHLTETHRFAKSLVQIRSRPLFTPSRFRWLGFHFQLHVHYNTLSKSIMG